MPWPEEFTDFTAILALIISLASLGLSLWNYRRDRSFLKVSLDFQARTNMGSAYLVNVTNTGRRPATVTKLVVRLKNGKRHSISIAEKKLSETDPVQYVVTLADFIPEIKHPLDIKVIEIEDTSKNVYKARTWKLWWHIRKVWTPDVDWISNNNKKVG